MRMISSPAALRFLHRTVAVALIATMLQATAWQQPLRGESRDALTLGECVDLKLRDGGHVSGRVAAKSNVGMYIEQSMGERVSIRYVDVLEIRDLDTGMSVAVPAPAAVASDTRWVKRVVLIGAAAVGLIWFFRITGCLGRCNY
jgi:hypothetical protein